MQGHIRKRVHTTKDGRTTTNWYVVVELPRSEEGKRRQKWHGGFATRREAEATRARLIHELNTGSYIEPHAVTLSKWVSDWWLPTTKTRVKPSTLDSYRRNLDLHALPPPWQSTVPLHHPCDAERPLLKASGEWQQGAEGWAQPKDRPLHPHNPPQSARGRCRCRDDRCQCSRAGEATPTSCHRC